MNDTVDTTERAEALVSRSRWPGWIWAVPIAALGIVAWLGVRHFMQEGPTITITFREAAGVKKEDTDIRYRGLSVGTVDSVSLSDDNERVVVTATINANAEELLRADTRFWLVGGDIGLDNLSALKTVISGPYIKLHPGSGEPAREFEGEDQPPPVGPDTDGTRFTLTTDRLASIGVGTPVTYHGMQVGQVVATALDEPGSGFRVDVFIGEPHDRLVRTGSRFWNAGGLRLSMAGGGFEASGSPAALVSGRIAFDTPDMETPPSEADDRFALYRSRAWADAGTLPGYRYRMDFEGAVGELEVGAPITFRGFTVGRVERVALRYDRSRDALETPVTATLDPARLDIDNEPATEESRTALDRALDGMIAAGLRGKLERNPPMIGAPGVSLAFEPAQEPGTLATAGEYPAIPTVDTGGGLAALKGSAQAAINDIREMNLPGIGQDVRETIQSAKDVISSPKIDRSLTNLDRALADIEDVTSTANGKVGPAIENLRQAAASARSALDAAEGLFGGTVGAANRSFPGALEEIAAAARSLRILADYLERHPEALLQGRDP